MNLVEELKARGLVEQESAPLEKILGTPRKVYHGVDPTADSLHIGNLVQLLLMRRLAQAGHKITLLVGGATGMIGDPKEKGERTLLDMRIIEKNKKALKKQIQQFIGARIDVVDNADWLSKVKLLDFLRDVGKHFSVNELIRRDIIKRRLETAEESISFTEFSYSLLQGYDYLYLSEKKGMDLQIGGSDQWANILSGVDLIRRRTGREVFAFTGPIVTDSTGKKFGKSEGNAVWLDPQKTSPFMFYQFWLNQPDDSIEKYLKIYTFMPLADIAALMEKHRAAPGEREAQETLARAVTELVHGPGATAAVAAAASALFSGEPLGSLPREARAVVLNEAPSFTLSRHQLSEGFPLVDAVVAGGLVPSKSEARRLIEAKGISLNGTPVTSSDYQLTAIEFADGMALVRKGKRDLLVLAVK